VKYHLPGGKRSLAVPMVLALALLVTGCGRVRENPAPQAVPEPATMRLAVYYLKLDERNAYLVREVHEVPKTSAVARAALEELIRGEPVTPGARRVLPPDTRVLGIKIENGLATVDFSKEVLRANVGAAGEALGIQSIVNTLTEFSQIDRVAFTVEGRLDQAARDWWGHVGLYGQPFRRDLSQVWEPAIWVTSPAPGTTVASPLVVRGSAMVFEGTVQGRVVAEGGRVLAQGFTTATVGAPGRGDFELRLDFPAPPEKTGWVEVYSISAEDGREEHLVRVPVRFGG